MRAPTPLTLRPATTAWATLAFLSALNLLNYLDRYVMSAVLTPLQKDLHLDDAYGGMAASAFMLGYFITAPFFGYLGDRYPRKYLMFAGVLIWSMATAASGLAHDFTQLFCTRIVVGIGEAAFVTMGPSWISDLFAATRRNTALTLFYVAIPVGSAIGFTIGGWFGGHGDWRGAFIWAGLPGILFALCLLFLREPVRGEADGIVAEPSRTSVADILRLLHNRRYNLLVWGYAAQTFSMGGFGIWGAIFLQRMHGMSVGASSAVFGEMLAGTGLVATLLGGLIASKWRKTNAAAYTWLMTLSMLLATPVCFFALTVADRNLSLVGLGASMFFLFLPTGPIASEMFAIVPVHLRASSMALCTFIIHLFGDWGSPTLVGFASDHFDSHSGAGDGLRTGVLLLPIVLVVGTILWSLLVRFTPAVQKVEP